LIRVLRDTGARWRFILVLVACTAVPACQTLSLNSLFHPSVPPARPAEIQGHPTTTVPPASRATTGESLQAAKPARQITRAPVLKLAPAENPAASISAREQAEQTVSDASKKLAMLDRSKLQGQEATDYDLLAGFVKGAERALKEQDFLRAQSLAEKASVMAARLGIGATPAP
jgi:hypothetical protein